MNLYFNKDLWKKKISKTKKRLYAEGKIKVWNKGKHHTKETIRKISLAKKGQTSWNKGKKLPSLSEEHKRKISEGLAYLKGVPRSEEVKKKISEAEKRAYQEGRRINPNKDKHLSEIHKLRISLAQKGKKLSAEHIKKLSGARMKGIKEGRIATWNKGISWNEEQKKVLSKAHIGQKAWNKGMPMLEEAKIKMSAKKQGISLKKWKMFTSKEPYGEKFNEKLKDKIRKRDNYTCQLCNKTEQELRKKLDTHHIDYDKRNHISINLISLCKSCHAKTNSNRKKWYNQLTHLNAINFWKRLLKIKKQAF